VVKKGLIIICSLITLIGSIIYYTEHYTLYDVVEDEMLFLNPFQPLKSDYDYYALNASIYLKKKDTANARYFFRKMLTYRNSFNERQYEEIFSCGNEYWEYKQKLQLKYSQAYEVTGQLDSAVSCIQLSLIHAPTTIERFIDLQLKINGKQKILQNIKNGMNHVGKLDCDMCDYGYYMFGKYKIGISPFEYELAQTNPEELYSGLLKLYGITP